MILAKYADKLYLLQPVIQVNRIEKQRPTGRDTAQAENSFASLFQKAKENHAAAQKQLSKGFDVLC